MLKDTLLKLLTIPGPSGFEGACADYIEGEVKPFVDETHRDVLGNLVCVKKGAPGGKRILLTAHMDEIGFIVTAIEDSGFLRVAAIGGVSPALTQASHVVLSSGAQGVLFLEDGADKPSLFIDIGASSKEEAEAKAQIGDWAVVRGVVSDMGSRLAAPYMDDRSGCAVLMETLRRLEKTDNEIIAVFTTQEEVGLRGATTAGYAADPDLAVALDVTHAKDFPSSRKSAYVVSRLGQGAAIKIMDRGLIAHPDVVAALEQAARDAGVPWQREILLGGSTDGAAIHKSRGGVPTGVISIPCRYVHAPCEMVDLRDLEGAVRILLKLL